MVALPSFAPKVEAAEATALVKADRLQVRAPNVPIVYGENRRMAEDWTYRFLETAWRELGGGGAVAGAARLAGLAGYG